jgi:glutamate-1-semialdehyde 2,1-aminomutase
MAGGYHGTHDFAEVSIVAAPEDTGWPAARLEGAGIPACVLEGIIVSRFNDLGMIEEILEAQKNRIAAVIVEPMLGSGGGIPARPGFLKGLRELTKKHDVLLIFDEIITFRMSLGGMQRLAGVTPDLTALGKIIGGGFAIGAFGGRKDVMERFDPSHPHRVVHAGTFNGHNVTMAAGVATLQNYDQVAIDRINELGTRLRQGFNQAFRSAGIKGQGIGFGSVSTVHWTDQEIVSAEHVRRSVVAAAELPRLLHLEMMNNGVFSAARGMYCISTPMTDKEIDQAIQAFDATLRILKPYVAEKAPHLLAD